MKKILGKKAKSCNGTVLAFACNCLSMCNIFRCECENVLSVQGQAFNMSKLIAQGMTASQWLY